MCLFGIPIEHFSAHINTPAMEVTKAHVSCDHILCIQQEIKM